MNDWEETTAEEATGEAEQRIGLYRDALTDRNAALVAALEKIRIRAEDERYGIQAQRLSDIAEMAATALKATG